MTSKGPCCVPECGETPSINTIACTRPGVFLYTNSCAINRRSLTDPTVFKDMKLAWICVLGADPLESGRSQQRRQWSAQQKDRVWVDIKLGGGNVDHWDQPASQCCCVDKAARWETTPKFLTKSCTAAPPWPNSSQKCAQQQASIGARYSKKLNDTEFALERAMHAVESSPGRES
jgi:hypothetical protein